MEINPIEALFQRLSKEGKTPLILHGANPTLNGLQFPVEILKKGYDLFWENPLYCPDSKGLLEAREALSHFYEKKGISLTPSQFLLTSGTSESLLHLFHLLAPNGGPILIPHPGYPLFEPIAQLTMTSLLPYALKEEEGWCIDWEDLEAKALSKPKALVVVSPHNPTGAVLSAEDFLKIQSWCLRHEVPLICDEVFSEFIYDGLTAVSGSSLPNLPLCFTLNGISKMLSLPSCKLSWIGVSGKKENVSWALKNLEISADTFLTVHTGIQKALPTLLEEGEIFVRQARLELEKRRDLALSLLAKKVGIVKPKGGYMLSARVPKKIPFDDEKLVMELMEKKSIFVHPGYFYDHGPEVYLVISFLTKPEILEPGLRALVDFLGAFV